MTTAIAQPRHHLGRELLVQPAQESHIVQFYEDDDFLCDIVSEFLAAGLQAGEPLLVIATPAHRAAVVARLATKGFELERAPDRRRLILLDARAILAQVTRGGAPDPARFGSVIGGALAALEGGRRRVYGEMVDLLWRDGEHQGAVQMEALWNEIVTAYPLSLLCAYGMGNFRSDADRDAFQHICQAHSHVLPAETYIELPDKVARLREVSLLQQRARALENEIEHRKRSEQALIDALQARDDFLAAASHELRTPLTALQLYMRGLAALTRQADPCLQSRVDNANRQIKRLADLIGQLLEVSQITGHSPCLQKQPFDLAALAREVAAATAASTGSRVQVLTEEAVHGAWDPDRIARVLESLLANAVEYGHGKPIELLVMRNQDHAQVRVRDHGIGIAEADQARIFERFERAANNMNYPGMGLGLWIARRIAEAHGGAIRVDSALGEGATFTLELPL